MTPQRRDALRDGALNSWTVVGRTDGRARALANQHYSRGNPLAVEFCPPGNNIVLVHLVNQFIADALWVSHRPDPSANLEHPRMDGFDYWDNPFFRNESGIRSSDMIREAISITLYLWDGHLPKDGFHSFVDPRYVPARKRWGKPYYGYCFKAAGFELHPERTKDNKLWRFILPMSELWQVSLLKPHRAQLNLFEVAA